MANITFTIRNDVNQRNSGGIDNIEQYIGKTFAGHRFGGGFVSEDEIQYYWRQDQVCNIKKIEENNST